MLANRAKFHPLSEQRALRTGIVKAISALTSVLSSGQEFCPLLQSIWQLLWDTREPGD